MVNAVTNFFEKHRTKIISLVESCLADEIHHEKTAAVGSQELRQASVKMVR